jgi:hypothetical protein
MMCSTAAVHAPVAQGEWQYLPDRGRVAGPVATLSYVAIELKHFSNGFIS